MALHIGIAACSAEGAALCYRTICTEAPALLGGHAHPPVSLHTPSLEDYMQRIYAGDWPGVADIMLDSAQRLAKAGADFLICPDNTIHQALPLVEPRSPLPWLHIAKVVGEEAEKRHFKKVGLTGTRWLMEGPVYPADLLRPSAEEREEINRIIMDELVRGEFKASSIEYFKGIFRKFEQRGCEAVVLGCTEIPLIMSDANSPLPTLDSTRLLARAALRRAVSAAR